MTNAHDLTKEFLGFKHLLARNILWIQIQNQNQTNSKVFSKTRFPSDSVSKAFLILLCLQCYNTNSLENIFIPPKQHLSVWAGCHISCPEISGIINMKCASPPAQPAYHQAQCWTSVGLFVPNKPIINPLNFLTRHFAAFHWNSE